MSQTQTGVDSMDMHSMGQRLQMEAIQMAQQMPHPGAMQMGGMNNPMMDTGPMIGMQGTEVDEKSGQIITIIPMQAQQAQQDQFYQRSGEAQATDKQDFRQRYMQGSLFINAGGDTVVPEANEVIRQRHFTLEGYTLAEQLDEIRRIRNKQKKEEDKSRKLNDNFKAKVESFGATRHVVKKYGVLPKQYLWNREMEDVGLGIFEKADEEGKKDEHLELEYPEWFKAVLELSGITAMQDHINEDQMRRQEPDFVHDFPEVYRVVNAVNFEFAGGFLILLNAFVLALQLHEFDRTAGAAIYDLAENFFVLIFFAEWLLRIIAYGWTSIFDKFNAFDTFLVVGCGFLPMFILPIIGFSVQKKMLRTFTALRTVRMVRVAKAVRFRPGFREMWEIVNGFACSITTVSWTLVMVFILTFVASVLAVKLFGQADGFNEPHHDREFVKDYFGSVQAAMLSMFQVLTLDLYGDQIVRRLTVAAEDGGAKILATRLYFVIFILVATFIMLNSVMAILVEKTFSLAKMDDEQAARDMQKAKEEELQILTELFLDIDVDRSGDLTKREFMAALDFNEYIRARLIDLQMTPQYLKESWEILDDGDGMLSVYEFTSGIRALKGNAKTKDVLDTQKRLEYCKGFIEDILEGKIVKMDRVLFIIQKDLQEMRQDSELLATAIHTLANIVQRFYGKAKKKAVELAFERDRIKKAHEIEMKARAEAEEAQRLQLVEEAKLANKAKGVDEDALRNTNST